MPETLDDTKKKAQVTLYIHPDHLRTIDDAILRIHPADRPSRNQFIRNAAIDAARSTKKQSKTYR